MQTLVMFQHAENMGEWTGMASGETIRNVRQCPSSACPKDLLYLRQGSSQCHKDLHTAGHPDFRKSTTQSQQHKKMPLVSAVPCTQIFDGSIKNFLRGKKKYRQAQSKRMTEKNFPNFFLFLSFTAPFPHLSLRSSSIFLVPTVPHSPIYLCPF